MKKGLLNAALLLALAAAGHFIAYKMLHIPRQAETALLFAGVVFYPILRYPLLGVYAFFIVSPFIPYIRRLYYLVYERPGTDPLIMLGEMIVAFVLAGLFFEFRERRDRDASASFYSRLVMGYFVFMVLRVFIFSYGPVSYTLPRFKFYGPPVLLFFLGKHYATRFAHLQRLWFYTIGIASVSALYALKQLYIGYSDAERIWFSTVDFSTLAIENIVRPFSFFQAPVILADYLQMGLFGIIMVWLSNRRFPRMVLVILGTLFSGGILITSVRSSWIGALATPLVLLAFVNVRGLPKRLTTVCLLVAAYFLFEFFSVAPTATQRTPAAPTRPQGDVAQQQYLELLVASRSGALTNPFDEHSFVSRLMTWQMIIKTSTDLELALVGRGMGQFKADSLYFTYLAEYGYPGMILILFIIGAFVWKGLKTADTARDARVVALAKTITVMSLVLALMSITGTHIHTFPGDAYFWFWNGVLANANSLDRELCAEAESSMTDTVRYA